MLCVYCGTKLPDGARFCFMCGKKVEPADNAENIVAANSGSIEIQEDPTTNSSEKSPDAPEPAIEGDLVEDAHNAFATTNENDPDETSAEGQSSEQAHGASEPADENDHDEAEEGQGLNPTKLDAPNNSSSETIVIPLATPSDKTTILPGFGAEKAALEQEKSDEIAALAALYPDANPEQFCDPTPFEAKSPDITEFIAPMPINGAKPASAESIHYAESPKKKSAGKRALLITIVVIIAALAAAAAFGMSLDISPN